MPAGEPNCMLCGRWLPCNCGGNVGRQIGMQTSSTARLDYSSIQTGAVPPPARFWTNQQSGQVRFSTLVEYQPETINLPISPNPIVRSDGSPLSGKKWEDELAEQRAAYLDRLVAAAEDALAKAREAAAAARKQEAEDEAPIVVGGRKIRFLPEEE